jgi:hypothetical protein
MPKQLLAISDQRSVIPPLYYRLPGADLSRRRSLRTAPYLSVDWEKSRGAKSFRSRRHVCHSCEVPGDS